MRAADRDGETRRLALACSPRCLSLARSYGSLSELAALSSSCKLQRAAGGLIGLTLALLLETILLVIRTNVVPELPVERRLRRPARRRDAAQKTATPLDQGSEPAEGKCQPPSLTDDEQSATPLRPRGAGRTDHSQLERVDESKPDSKKTQ